MIQYFIKQILTNINKYISYEYRWDPEFSYRNDPWNHQTRSQVCVQHHKEPIDNVWYWLSQWCPNTVTLSSVRAAKLKTIACLDTLICTLWSLVTELILGPPLFFYTVYHVSYPVYSILTGGSIVDNLMGKSGASCDSLWINWKCKLLSGKSERWKWDDE